MVVDFENAKDFSRTQGIGESQAKLNYLPSVPRKGFPGRLPSIHRVPARIF